MIEVQPEELSALLDGELDPARAAQVRAQIEQDPQLRQEFANLSANDAAWRAAAIPATDFAPAVTLPVHAAAQSPAGDAKGGWLPALAVATGILIAVRTVLKLSGSDALGLALPLASLLLLIPLVVWLAQADPRDAANTHSGEHAL